MKKMKFLEKEIHNSFYEHRKLLDSIYSKKFSKKIINISNIIAKSLKSGGTIFWCGNGGSASDSQHLSAELIGRLKKNRKPLRSISLTSNIAGITCISNDFGYHKLFSRQLEGLGKKNDVIVCITTSGKSKNIIEVLKMARRKKLNQLVFWEAMRWLLSKLIRHC